MFLGLDLILYILGYLFIVYVILIRLIVLYSRCRVNQSTNLSVVLYYVIFLLLPLRIWASYVGRSQPVGRSPLCCSSLYNMCDLQGLQKSLVSVELTLCIVLKGTGGRSLKKRSSAF